MGKMIAKRDEPVSDDSLAPKIYALKYVSAVDIEDVLNELFLKKKQQRPYWYYFDDYPPETTERDVGRLYGKVRIDRKSTRLNSSHSQISYAVFCLKKKKKKKKNMPPR